MVLWGIFTIIQLMAAGESGLEPEVSCSKGRRVTDYTTPQ